MTIRSIGFTLFLCAAQGAELRAQQPGEPASLSAFVGVHVITMEDGLAPERRVLTDQTVLVEGGRITELGPREAVPVPAGAAVLAEGGWLLPGLVDMHVHIWSEQDFALFVANGVTSLRNMWGSPMHVAWRRRAEAGELFGPTVYTTGPIVDGLPPTWPGSIGIEGAEAARAEVERQAAAGYSAIKVYGRLGLEEYDAIVAAAREHGLDVVGHVPDAVGLARALAAKQRSIEHFEGYFKGLAPIESDMAGLVEDTLAAGTWNCPTLVVMHKIASLGDLGALRALPEYRFAQPLYRSMWQPENDFRFKDKGPEDFARMRERVRGMQALVAALHAAGAPLLVGSDTPNPFVVPGFSMHEELALLVAAGLSPYDALRAATAGAADFLRAEHEFGRVRAGLRADLVLAAADPLADLGHLREPLGVLVRGAWYDGRDLRERIEALAAPWNASPGLGQPGEPAEPAETAEH